MITAERVNVTVQYTSQSGPTPIKVWQNPGMICPVTGSALLEVGNFSLEVLDVSAQFLDKGH